ncbi:MAG: tautomerase family protein [Candidatus Aminicenantes bacterium]|nr:tautomerase family protein [Candidatus Aminicenantes bacterium]
MPIVSICMLPGRSQKTKKILLRNVTAAVTSSLEVKPEAVRIIIHEIPYVHFGIAGLPADEFRRRAGRKSKKQDRKISSK